MKISTFKIDVEDAADLKKHISILQKTRKNLLRDQCNYAAISFGSSNQNMNELMPIFEHILNIKCPNNEYTEIPNDNETKDYYVYMHCDPTKKLSLNRDIREVLLASKYGLTHMPFYVGKGIGGRCYELSRNEGHRKIRTKLIQSDKDIQVIKVNEGLTEIEALFEEQKLIAVLGLSSLNKNGMLINLQTDKSIITYFIKALPEFEVPPELADRYESSTNKMISKYENFIKIIANWV